MSEYYSPIYGNPYPYPQPPVETSSEQRSGPSTSRASYRESASSSIFASKFQEHLSIRGVCPPEHPNTFKNESEVNLIPVQDQSRVSLPESLQPPKITQSDLNRVSGTMAAISEMEDTENLDNSDIEFINRVIHSSPVQDVELPQNNPNPSMDGSKAPPQKLRVPQRLQKRVNSANANKLDTLSKSYSNTSTLASPSVIGTPRKSTDTSRSGLFGSLRKKQNTPPPADLPYFIPPLRGIQPHEEPPKPRAPPSPKDLPYVLPPLTKLQEEDELMPAFVNSTRPRTAHSRPSTAPARSGIDFNDTGREDFYAQPSATLMSELREQHAVRLTTTRDHISLDVHRSTALQMDIAEQRYMNRPAMSKKERREAEKKGLRVKAELNKLNKEELKKAEIRSKRQAKEERKRTKDSNREAERMLKLRHKERKRAAADLARRVGSAERFAQSEFQMKMEKAARKMKRWVGLTDPGWE